MKSGLEDRNNTLRRSYLRRSPSFRLNEVRPGRPEQYAQDRVEMGTLFIVSMKSGLEDRNNTVACGCARALIDVSMKSGLEDRNNGSPQKAALARNFTSTCELSAPPGPIKPLC